MTAAYINGQWACYSTTDGIRKHYLGCRHETPKAQIAHATGAYVSPRRSGEASTHGPSAPLLGRGQLDASPERLGSFDITDPPRP